MLVLLQVLLWAGCSLDDNDGVAHSAAYQAKGLREMDERRRRASYDFAMMPDNYMVYFEIYKGELYTSWKWEGKPLLYYDRVFRVAGTIRMLLLNKDNNIPDTSFLMNLGDGLAQNDARSPYGESEDRDYTQAVRGTLPVFVFSRDRYMRNAEHFPLFPDDYSIGSGDPDDFYAGGLDAGMRIIQFTDKKPYADKKKKIMWRGKNTSPHCYCNLEAGNVKPGCYTSPKMLAVNLSVGSDHLDVKFAAAHYTLISSCDRMWGTSVDNVISRQERGDYGKLLVMDGYKSTYPGFAHSLWQNAVSLKVEGSNTNPFPQNVWEQWFHSQLVPYYHFYPVDSLSMNESLRNAYDFLDIHQDVAKAIARRSTEFAKEHLTTCALEKYIVLILKLYQEKTKIGCESPLSEPIHEDIIKYSHERFTRHVENGLMVGTLSRNKSEGGAVREADAEMPIPYSQTAVPIPIPIPGSDNNITEIREMLVAQRAVLASLQAAVVSANDKAPPAGGSATGADSFPYLEILVCALLLNVVFQLVGRQLLSDNSRRGMYS